MDQAAEVTAALMATLSPDREQRRNAEAFLSKLETQPGFAVLLLQLVSAHLLLRARTAPINIHTLQVQQHASGTSAESTLVRAASAVFFKVGPRPPPRVSKVQTPCLSLLASSIII